MRILISTGEVSGDVVGALLTRAIRAERPDAVVYGIGGPHMERAGAVVRFSSSHLGTVGVTEAIAMLPSFARAFGTVRAIVRDYRPDVAVLIGNDLFHTLLGRWLRSRGVRTVAFFPPQIWVWRSLARPIAGSFDAVLTSFPDEQAVYERASRTTKVAFVGHYLADVLAPRTPASQRAARTRIGAADRGRIVCLLPGSRGHEVRCLLPVLAGAARRLRDGDPALRFVVPVADDRYRPLVEQAMARAGIGAEVRLVRGPSHDAMIAADLLIVASGTASLEAAILGVPMVILYKVSTLTYGVVRACIGLGLLASDTVGLPNLVLGRRAVPELIQQRVTAPLVAAEAAAVLASVERRQEMMEAFAEVRRRVSGGRSLERAARQLIEWAAPAPQESPLDRAVAGQGGIVGAFGACGAGSGAEMSERRVVITGLGVVSPLGNDLESTLAGLFEGRNGWTAAAPAAARFGNTLVAEVTGFDPRPYFRAPKALKLAGRATGFAVAASAMALRDAGWPDAGGATEMLGVALGSSGSDLQVEDVAQAIGPDPDRRAVSDVAFFGDRILAGLHPLWLLVNLPNMVSAHVAIQCGARGPNTTVMTDWAAGTQAIGEACDWIRRGDADAVLAGGADSGLYPFARAGYEQANLGGAAPGCGSGFVPGEGAAVLLLEEHDRARGRGARVLGEIAGYATACAAVDSEGAPDGDGGALAGTMAAALDEAGWSATDLNRLINATMFDARFLALERAAAARVFGEAPVRTCVTDFTSRLGHALAAAGAIDAALGVALAARSAGGRGTRILCNSVGYSGQAASLAIVAAARADLGRDAS